MVELQFHSREHIRELRSLFIGVMPHNEVANRPSYKTYTQADWEVDISLASFHGL